MSMRLVVAVPLAILAFAATDAAAQDLAPALDPATIAQGQVIAGTARGYAERGGYRERGSSEASPENSRRTCANARSAIRRGNADPRLRQLMALCRQGGY